MRLLLTLFILRVLGQLIVVLFAPSWLPPMEAWYSGLLPYPLLLPAQIAIIALMLFMIRRPPSRRLAIFVNVFATLYAVGMIVRYAILRTHEIPVAFHLVLAAFLFVYAREGVSPATRARFRTRADPPG